MTKKVITPEQWAHMQTTLGQAAGIVKIYTGVCNNCTYLVMADAYDAIRRTPIFRHEVKHNFREAFRRWKQYEAKLLYSSHNRLFHVADIQDDAREKYSNDLTDAQYFEFWQGTGGRAFLATQDELNVLRHKYYLSLNNHGVPYAEALSKILLAEVCLKLSCRIYEDAEKDCIEESPSVPEEMFRDILRPLSIRPIEFLWRKAMLAVNPKIFEYNLDEFEARNQDMALKSLAEKWTSVDFVFDSTADAMKDFKEVFRSKKAARQAYLTVHQAKKEIANA